MTKFITHAGIFHADELFAIATVLDWRWLNFQLPHIVETEEDFINCPGTVIWRTNQVPEKYLDAELVYVIDIGGQFDPNKLNFDHHQSRTSPASNMLLLDYVMAPYQGLRDKMSDLLYQEISDIDVGAVRPSASSISSVINMYNNLPGAPIENFRLALGVAVQSVAACRETAIKAIQFQKLWDRMESPTLGCKVLDDASKYSAEWKELAAQDGTVVLCSPNIRGGWQLMVRDSNELQIPVSDLQTFRHNSGFMATYVTKDEAIEHAKLFMISYWASKNISKNI